jgi:hypothetical protein
MISVSGKPASTQAEERQDREDHDDQADEIDQLVHVGLRMRSGPAPPLS